SLELPASARGIAIDGARAIVSMDALDGTLLGLVDLSDPTAPRLEGSIALTGLFAQGAVRADAGRAWVMADDRSPSGQRVLVSLDLASREVTSHPLGEGAAALSGFDVAGDRLVT